MSDFDKEAEREKLREKFDRDKEKRKHSERMSELLLKGATMTNKHHDCGSPIFRWQGEEFCPSCESPVGGGAETASQQPSAATEVETEVPEDVERAPEMDGQTTSEEMSADSDAAEIDVTPQPAPGENGVDSEPATATESTGTERQTTPEPTRQPSRAASGSTGGRTTAGEEPATGEGVAVAWASLERTLVDVARQAEETADLSRKRDLLAAAREAAEALEATRRASR